MLGTQHSSLSWVSSSACEQQLVQKLPEVSLPCSGEHKGSSGHCLAPWSWSKDPCLSQLCPAAIGSGTGADQGFPTQGSSVMSCPRNFLQCHEQQDNQNAKIKALWLGATKKMKHFSQQGAEVGPAVQHWPLRDTRHGQIWQTCYRILNLESANHVR